MQYYAVIVASGTGKRMGMDMPKQFALLNEQPVLAYALKAFHESTFKPKIVLVLHADFLDLWQAQVQTYGIEVPHQVIVGGAERFDSVKNGIQHLSGNALVAIHDGARPLIKPATIDRLFVAAQEKGNAVPVIVATESARYHDQAIDRSALKMVQTPQIFSLDVLKDAYSQSYDPAFTDDASVVEKNGTAINLEEGQIGNLKITWLEDLKIASALIS